MKTLCPALGRMSLYRNRAAPGEAWFSYSPTVFIKEQAQDLEADVLGSFSAKVFNFSGPIFYICNMRDIRVYLRSDGRI